MYLPALVIWYMIVIHLYVKGHQQILSVTKESPKNIQRKMTGLMKHIITEQNLINM